MKKLSLAVGLVLAVGGAQAADSGFYIGAGIGQTKASADTAGAIMATQALGGTPTSVKTDDTDSTYRLLGGLNFNKYIGLEVIYADLGEGKVTIYDAFNDMTDTYKVSVSGFGAALTGRLPITDKLSGFAKVGAFNWDSDLTATVDMGGTIGVVSAKVSESGTDPMVGIGMVYRFNNQLSVRGELERIDIDKGDAGAGDFDTLTANLILSF